MLQSKTQVKIDRSSEDNLQEQIEHLISNREAFNKFVYTPLDEAVKELEIRKKDSKLGTLVNKNLLTDIPDALKKNNSVVLHRQVVTPNYEVGRFANIVDALEFNPVFFEYADDKFVTENDWKYYLGNMGFYLGIGKKGGVKVEHVRIIDFNIANGKKISEVKTHWGQSLIDFHHELLLKRFPNFKESIFDGSTWYSENGGNAKSYYEQFLLLFIKDSILFENFMLDIKEVSFTREVFLPAFIRAMRITGKKPLIVALEPTDIEGENFWLYHPHESKNVVIKKSEK